MIYIKNLKKEMGNKLLFENAEFTIYDKDRIGIIGANGSGKTTLLRILLGELESDCGSVTGKIYKTGYLKQASEYTEEDFIKIANDSFIKNFLTLKSMLNIKEDIDFTKERLSVLSGGEKTKLMLAKILSDDPGILFLDEPTNHLDKAAIEWLINVIKEYNGIVVIISHDRAFLNATINHIIEIENEKINEYFGNYDDYRLEKNEKLTSLKKQFLNQKKLEKKIDNQIEKLTKWSNKGENLSRRQGGMASDSRICGAQTSAQSSAQKLASSAKAKQKRLEQQKQDFIETPYEEKKIFYNLSTADKTAKILLEASDVSKYFDDIKILEKANFIISNKDKIALIGLNGVGKTTFIKMLLGQESISSGKIWLTPSLKIAYLCQDVFDLPENITIMQYASRNGADYKTLFLTNLINMNINRDFFERKISTLSLGERMKIKLCDIILSDYNLIILDEPTNHLDINNKERLEEVLKGYQGALLIVSHDEYFLKEIVNKTFLIKDYKIIEQNF